MKNEKHMAILKAEAITRDLEEINPDFPKVIVHAELWRELMVRAGGQKYYENLIKKYLKKDNAQ